MKSSSEFNPNNLISNDLIGRRFGKLTVIDYNPEKSKALRMSVWNCKCDCGNKVAVERAKLINGKRTDCGDCDSFLCKPGTKFGKLTVIEQDKQMSIRQNTPVIHCKCDCGNDYYCRRIELLNGTKTQCQTCQGLKKNNNDLTGQKFGMLTVICYDKDKSKRAKRSIWECRCDCGNITYCSTSNLRGGISTSCGCKRKLTIQNNYKIDMIGKRFGRLTVISENKDASKKLYKENGKIGSTIVYYDCKCDCGNIITVRGSSLRSGNTTSCGQCYNKEDLTGQKFGDLTVVGLDHFGPEYKDAPTNSAFWKCKCVCGKEILVTTHKLNSGNTTSCGCRIKTGLQSRGKFGIYHNELRGKYNGIISRCYNKNNEYYKDYGGRGIYVCDRWLGDDGLEHFYYDMIEGFIPGLTVDRIDVNGPYSPENCRWSTVQEQQYNKRTNVYVDYYGKKICLAELVKNFAKVEGLDPSKMSQRINYGYTVDEALSKPLYTSVKKENYFKDYPLIRRPFMFKEELDIMNLFASDIDYTVNKDKLKETLDNSPTAEDYWGKGYNNKKNNNKENN